MRKQEQNIDHVLDVWHLCISIKTESCKELRPWIGNHVVGMCSLSTRRLVTKMDKYCILHPRNTVGQLTEFGINCQKEGCEAWLSIK